MTGDEFRDHLGKLLRTRYDSVRTEVALSGKNADILFEIVIGPRHRLKVAVECKLWSRPLIRDDVRDIIHDYDAAHTKREFDELWIISKGSPAPGARLYVESYRHCQIMTETECEQALINFQPLLSFLVSDYQKDAVSKYYIPPKVHGQGGTVEDLHTKVNAWLEDPVPRPIAIWAGYGMGKTTYARYLSSVLADNCTKEYGAPIPILLNLGEFTTAPNIENLIVSQLSNHYGVREISSAAFRILNEQRRFVLILDGFDEMKFAMAPNEFSHISAQIRRTAKINPRLLLLGRPSAIENEDEKDRLTSSQIQVHDQSVRMDEGPDFTSLRLAPLTRDEYLSLIRNLLNSAGDRVPGERTVEETMAAVEGLKLGDILGRPVQAKMLAEVVGDPRADIKAISRFSLYDLFIKRILRREA